MSDETIAEVKRAGRRVVNSNDTELFAEDLDPDAGTRLRRDERDTSAAAPRRDTENTDKVDALVKAYIETASVDIARAWVGMSRSAAYRWLTRSERRVTSACRVGRLAPR